MKLLVRNYESGRRARCLCFDDGGKGKRTYCVSLDKSFGSDGGMTQYETYSLGGGKFSDFKYEELTNEELMSLDVLGYPIAFSLEYGDVDITNEVKILKLEKIKIFRKEKLKQLNKLL
jgi:hypothetical protein